MNRLRRLSAVAAVAVLVPLGCNGSADDSAPSKASEQTGNAAIAFDPDRQPPAPEIEGAVRGGVVTVRGDYGLDSTDPSAWGVVSGNILSELVTRSLTQYAFDPAQGTVVLVPDLATDIGTPNDDYTEWTYTIRKGVRFEDGTPVTADDVAYGIKRSFDRTITDLPLTGNTYFLHSEQYRGPYDSGTDYDAVIVDGDTLTLTMKRPFPEMPYWGASSAMGPIPATGSKPAYYASHPLATGPYKLADLTPGESLTLVRNDQWDPDTDPGRHQYADRFEFSFTDPLGRTEPTILTDTSKGQTTLMYQNASPEAVQEAQANAPDLLVAGPGGCAYFLWPDYRKIRQLEVRQALGYAFPYREFWRFQGQDLDVTRLPGTSYLPPGVPGRIEEPVLSSEPWQTDANKARALLKQAGYERGKYKLSFAYVDPEFVYKDALVEALERAGFAVAPYKTSWQQYDAVIADRSAPINLRLGGWCPDWPSGTGYLESMLTRGGGANYFSYFHEQAVDDEFARIENLPLDEQPAAIGALEHEIQARYYPGVVTGYDGRALLHGSRIGGMNLGAYGAPTYKDIYVMP